MSCELAQLMPSPDPQKCFDMRFVTASGYRMQADSTAFDLLASEAQSVDSARDDHSLW